MKERVLQCMREAGTECRTVGGDREKDAGAGTGFLNGEGTNEYRTCSG